MEHIREAEQAWGHFVDLEEETTQTFGCSDQTSLGLRDPSLLSADSTNIQHLEELMKTKACRSNCSAGSGSQISMTGSARVMSNSSSFQSEDMMFALDMDFS
mmetsp:Transcript_37149/g.54423  ORF Transcript_37149/g.54423 Transcript_37149/m.54423 type:complete len:102 (-) Transcript_37149:521-826(-)